MTLKRNLFIFGLAGFISVLVIFLFGNDGFAVAPKKNPIPSDFHTGITWEDAQKNEKPIVVNFYVDWCNACRRFAPIFDSLRTQYGSEYNFVIVKTDSPINEPVVRQFYIPAYPTVYLVDKENNRKLLVEHEKYFNDEALKKELENFIN